LNESLQLGTEGQDNPNPSHKRSTDSHKSNPHGDDVTIHKKLRPEKRLNQVTSMWATSRRVIVCYRCRETGHKLRDCPYNPKARNSQGSSHYSQEQRHGDIVNNDLYRPSSSQPSQTRAKSNSQTRCASAMVQYTHFPNRT
jgi:hypothetical protein